MLTPTNKKQHPIHNISLIKQHLFDKSISIIIIIPTSFVLNVSPNFRTCAAVLNSESPPQVLCFRRVNCLNRMAPETHIYWPPSDACRNSQSYWNVLRPRIKHSTPPTDTLECSGEWMDGEGAQDGSHDLLGSSSWLVCGRVAAGIKISISPPTSSW